MRAIVPLMESFLKNTLDSLNKVQTSQILVPEIIPSTLQVMDTVLTRTYSFLYSHITKKHLNMAN